MGRKNKLDVYHDAVIFMREHLFEKLYVTDIADHCGVSPSGLEKIFADLAKIGIMRYFLDLKLEYAARMLKNGDAVRDTAQQLNFSSTAHFSMAFKKKFGVSPLKYKRI